MQAVIFNSTLLIFTVLVIVFYALFLFFPGCDHVQE